MAGVERINCLHYADAKLFYEHLRKFAQQDPRNTYFRGQTEDWPLVPTACRGSTNEWAYKWIDQFVISNKQEYGRFLHCEWEKESVEEFQSRFELALRNYIECDISFQFQQLATELNLIHLSNVEQVSSVDPAQILDYLRLDKIPLAGQIRYASLLAQHHGVPTRLLDWTSSLDVAIDFAVSGVNDPASSDGTIVIWAINEWGHHVPNSDRDCENHLYNTVITQTGDGGGRFHMETPLKGTCLKLFKPLDITRTPDVYLTTPLQVGKDELPVQQTYRISVDNVNEVYINEQQGRATADIRHDRHVYEKGSCQSFEARVSASYIPKDRVFKFSLPHSEIPYWRPQLGKRRIYDLPEYAQFDDVDQPNDISVEEKRRIRERNFLSVLGQRINSDIAWDAFGI